MGEGPDWEKCDVFLGNLMLIWSKNLPKRQTNGNPLNTSQKQFENRKPIGQFQNRGYKTFHCRAKIKIETVNIFAQYLNTKSYT